MLLRFATLFFLLPVAANAACVVDAAVTQRLKLMAPDSPLEQSDLTRQWVSDCQRAEAEEEKLRKAHEEWRKQRDAAPKNTSSQ
jgi:hypothetical protein